MLEYINNDAAASISFFIIRCLIGQWGVIFLCVGISLWFLYPLPGQILIGQL